MKKKNYKYTIADLVIYTEDELPLFQYGFLSYIKEFEMDKMDSFKLGAMASDYHYNLRIIRHCFYRNIPITDYASDSILNYIKILESTPNLIEHLVKWYNNQFKNLSLSDLLEIHNKKPYNKDDKYYSFEWSIEEHKKTIKQFKKYFKRHHE